MGSQVSVGVDVSGSVFRTAYTVRGEWPQKKFRKYTWAHEGNWDVNTEETNLVETKMCGPSETFGKKNCLDESSSSLTTGNSVKIRRRSSGGESGNDRSNDIFGKNKNECDDMFNKNNCNDMFNRNVEINQRRKSSEQKYEKKKKKKKKKKYSALI
eukprot:Trichotokara_eunicae@DN2432_c0_g1_i6.p1